MTISMQAHRGGQTGF